MRTFEFKPRLIPTLGTILVLPILLALGFWQLDRADQKHVLQSTFESHQHAKPLTLKQVNARKENLSFYPLKARGVYDNKHQFLLDNKIHHQRVGYEVITPFISQQSKKIILVNRGWIPMGKSRQQLPKIKPILGRQTVIGFIKYPSKKQLVLQYAKNAKVHWPLRIQKIDIKAIAKHLGRPVYPFIVLLQQKQKHGFVREWKPINMKPQKHIAYAFQWFALALTLVIIYIGVNLRRKKRNPS